MAELQKDPASISSSRNIKTIIVEALESMKSFIHQKEQSVT